MDIRAKQVLTRCAQKIAKRPEWRDVVKRALRLTNKDRDRLNELLDEEDKEFGWFDDIEGAKWKRLCRAIINEASDIWFRSN